MKISLKEYWLLYFQSNYCLPFLKNNHPNNSYAKEAFEGVERIFCYPSVGDSALTPFLCLELNLGSKGSDNTSLRKGWRERLATCLFSLHWSLARLPLVQQPSAAPQPHYEERGSFMSLETLFLRLNVLRNYWGLAGWQKEYIKWGKHQRWLQSFFSK